MQYKQSWYNILTITESAVDSANTIFKVNTKTNCTVWLTSQTLQYNWFHTIIFYIKVHHKFSYLRTSNDVKNFKQIHISRFYWGQIVMSWLGTQLSASTGNFELQSAFYVIADSGVGSNKLKMKKVTPKSGYIVVRWRK